MWDTKSVLGVLCCLSAVYGLGYESEHDTGYAHNPYECTGDEQSPIVIDPYTKNDPRVKRVRYHDYGDGNVVTAVNDEHNIVIAVNGDTTPSISGSFFKDVKFNLKHIELKWGSSDSTGSEHRIGYDGFPAEAQFVHYNSKLTDEEAFDGGAKGIAILSFFIDIGYHNEVWEPLIAAMEEVSGSEETSTDVEVIIKDLIPKHAYNFYFYQGSETSPPCHENVLWHIFKKTIYFSADQLYRLRALKGPKGYPLTPNYREPQKINFRCVVGHFELKKSHGYNDKKSHGGYAPGPAHAPYPAPPPAPVW